MAKKKKDEMIVKITYPVLFGNRQILPGETATVPADVAEEWISTERAINAEVKWQPEEQ
jgi:hypothetical protein